MFPSGGTMLERPPDLDEKLRQIDSYYESQLQYPYLFVDEARRAAGFDGDSEMVYGTTPGRLTVELLELAGARPDDIFYDLGCGVGQCVLAAALFCTRATGVEILAPLAALGASAAQALKLPNASFRTTDLRTTDIRDGTLIYCYSTCMKPDTREQVARLVATTASGARVLSVTHNLEHPALELVSQHEMQWDDATRTVYLHLRKAG